MRFRLLVLALLLVLSGVASRASAGDPLLNAGRDQMAKGNYDSAITYFSMAIDIWSKNDEAYIDRGVACAAKNQLDSAVADLNTALQINPNSSEAYSSRAAVFVMKGVYDQAIADATMALQLNPGNPEAYYTRGVAGQLGQKPETVNSDLANAFRLGFKPAGDAAESFRRQ